MLIFFDFEQNAPSLFSQFLQLISKQKQIKYANLSSFNVLIYLTITNC